MKLIAQIKILFSLNLRYRTEIYKQKKYPLVIKIYVKISSLLSSILDRSMATTKPMTTYMGIITRPVKKAVMQI